MGSRAKGLKTQPCCKQSSQPGGPGEERLTQVVKSLDISFLSPEGDVGVISY